MTPRTPPQHAARSRATPRRYVPARTDSHAEAPSRPQSGVTVAPANLVVFSAPSGGIGTSTLTALVGLALSSRNVTCALLDADLDGGGLDVLLGIEHEPGLTLQDLDAPLGHIEGEALNREIPEWEGIRVLAHTPWRGANPEWWELEAAAGALAEANDVVLVDAGRGSVIGHIPGFATARQVMVVDLSVLGMARAKSHAILLDRLRGAAEDATGGRAKRAGRTDMTDASAEPPIIVGVEPRGVARRQSASSVAVAEAVAYLGEDVLGPVRCAPSLCSDMLAGLGIRAVPKRNRRVVDALADGILAAAGIRAPSEKRRPS